jgi:hypothetical protein
MDNIKASTSPGFLSKMALSPYLNLIFSIVFVVFVLGPPFLGYPLSIFPLMHIADVLDIFTPLILIPLYWLLFRGDREKPISLLEELTFMFLAGFWVLGQGMHLGANSIHNLLDQQGVKAGDILTLTYFYDETLGHYLWHIGVIGLSALIIYRSWRWPIVSDKKAVWSNITAGLLYGFTYFAMVNEGDTVPIGLPFSVLVIVFILFWMRNKIKAQPPITLFITSYSFALLLFAIWGIWQGGFRSFYEAGIMK